MRVRCAAATSRARRASRGGGPSPKTRTPSGRRQSHRGKLPDAEVQVPGGNPGCGDVVTLYLKAKEGDDRVAAVSFEGVGCTLSQAAASILAERANRLQPTFEEVLALSYEEM